MKWLRARCVSRDGYARLAFTFPRNLNVNDAKTMMINTLRWREEFKIEEVMKETYPDIFDGFGHLYGRDKEGRPVAYCPFWSRTLVLGSDGS
jgi:hypothetical protein